MLQQQDRPKKRIKWKYLGGLRTSLGQFRNLLMSRGLVITTLVILEMSKGHKVGVDRECQLLVVENNTQIADRAARDLEAESMTQTS